ncbi:MAG TPA: DNA helicase [Microbacterium sp.]|uniref:endonuclease domain-containing protein n=1 Tax=Microbacterium sp. TaxID=51671 RepID=UPI000EDD69FB|nr:DNA helicase [Microbacterium sp.]
MDLTNWLTTRGGIAHRADAAEHGFTPGHVRAAIRADMVRRIRSTWIALPGALPELVTAATASGRLSCVSLARRRGWWIPPATDAQHHLQVSPNAHRLVKNVVLHWAKPLVDRGDRVLEASVEDALSHIAQCLSFEDAMSVWESAVKVEHVDLESLRTVRWPDASSRACASATRGMSDSGLETIFVVRLSPWGIPMRQQVMLAGHNVDVLIGTHLVVQLDGFAFHSSSADRTRDVRHDAELRMRGYTVLRFTYAQIIHDWDYVEATVAAAIARGLHLSPAKHSRRA